jgi:molybdopterin synthase sulfur carrier subunit
MPVVQFTDNLARQIAAPPCDVEGTTVRECLEAAFRPRPALRGYILDDQGAVRQHVVVLSTERPSKTGSIWGIQWAPVRKYL